MSSRVQSPLPLTNNNNKVDSHVGKQNSNNSKLQKKQKQNKKMRTVCVPYCDLNKAIANSAPS